LRRKERPSAVKHAPQVPHRLGRLGSSTTEAGAKEAKMRPEKEMENIEQLLSDFNEVLRLEGRADFSLLERCPEAYRRELLSLMNVAALAYRALEPERTARRFARKKGAGS
jgi:hypothetical protein